MLRDLVELTRPFGEDADHLMGRKMACRRLYHQIGRSQPEVVDGGPIVLVVPGESQADDAQRQHRRGLRPRLPYPSSLAVNSERGRSIQPTNFKTSAVARIARM